MHWAMKIFRRKMSAEDEMFFVRQLELMLKVGISIPKVFDTLMRHERRRRRREILGDVSQGVIAGNTLESSLRRHQDFFNPTLISLVRIGELHGDLPFVLEKYLVILKMRDRIRKKMGGALLYPAIVVVAMMLLGIGASFVIFPEIERLFAGVQMELPLVTKVVIAVSRFMNRYGAILLAIFGALLIAAAVACQSSRGRAIYHRLILRAPLAGRIVRERQISGVMRNFAVLLQAGMSIVDVLQAAREAADHVQYRQSLGDAEREIRHGNPLSAAFAVRPDLYPPVVVELIAVGEETGSLQNVCVEIADFYEDRMFSLLDALPSIIEPVLILIVGTGVATIAVSILLPMYRFASSI